MENNRNDDLNELNNLANLSFQNATNLAPALRQVVTQAKAYQKAVHASCDAAVTFIGTLQNIANAAQVSEGATKKVGDVLNDVIETYKEIENMKLDLTKLFINEVIIPLESRAEIQIDNLKTTHKSYTGENKFQTELFEKSQSSYLKISKRADRKSKRSPKLEAKVREGARSFDNEEKKLRKVREDGLRKALIEERRIYCFVTERMCAYGRGSVVFNTRIAKFIDQKVNEWSQFIAKPTELPQESEDIIKNPNGYKFGTVRKKVEKVDKRATIRRGSSLNYHYESKYNTMESLSSSRKGSQPGTPGGIARANTYSHDGASTPSSYNNAPTTPKIVKSPPSPDRTPEMRTASGGRSMSLEPSSNHYMTIEPYSGQSVSLGPSSGATVMKTISVQDGHGKTYSVQDGTSSTSKGKTKKKKRQQADRGDSGASTLPLTD